MNLLLWTQNILFADRMEKNLSIYIKQYRLICSKTSRQIQTLLLFHKTHLYWLRRTLHITPTHIQHTCKMPLIVAYVNNKKGSRIHVRFKLLKLLYLGQHIRQTLTYRCAEKWSAGQLVQEGRENIAKSAIADIQFSWLLGYLHLSQNHYIVFFATHFVHLLTLPYISSRLSNRV